MTLKLDHTIVYLLIIVQVVHTFSNIMQQRENTMLPLAVHVILNKFMTQTALKSRIIRNKNVA